MSIGQTLREAREAAGLTVEQVSDATRIRGTLIRKIEQDDFSLCGGDVYARGHIRSIARVVGADPVPLLAEYDQQRGGPAENDPAAHVAHDLFDSQNARAAAAAARPRRPNWGAAIAVVLVLVCLYAGVRLLSGSGSGGTLAQGEASATATGSVSAPASPVSPGPSSAPSAPSTGPSTSIIARRPNAVTVAIAATRGNSWIQATAANGKVLYSGLLRKGATQDLSADTSIRLVIGNAGSLDLVVNGKPIGAPGKPGDVVRLSFGPQDPAAG